MTAPPLKLQARDADDIQVLAAVLQDAIAPVCDMMWQPEANNFVLVVHRFCWDQCPEGKLATDAVCFERVCCALDIHGVTAVQRSGFDPLDLGLMLDLLTLSLEGRELQLIFAGGARVKLTLGDWRLRLEDFGEPWPTGRQPCHTA